MSGLRTWLSRSFKTVPEIAREQTGVAITSLLFALVISQLAIELANEFAPVLVSVTREGVSADGQQLEQFAGTPLSVERLWAVWDDQSVAILHLMVAMTLTITSAIGYYTSRNLPRLSVRFFNIAFFQFVLDTLMVFVYFLATVVAEPHNSFADARPEAILVLAAFCLYVAWDVLSYRVSCSPLEQVALRSPPSSSRSYGWRRHVTWVCGLVSIGVLVLALCLGSSPPTVVVILIDLFLMFLLLAYRLSKTLGDRYIAIRGVKLELPSTAVGSEPSQLVSRIELEQVLPKDVFARLEIAVSISKLPGGVLELHSDSTLQRQDRHLDRLEDFGIVSCRLPSEKLDVDGGTESVTTIVELTSFGRYLCDAYEKG